MALLRQDPGAPLSQVACGLHRRPAAHPSPQRVVSLALRRATHLTAGERAELDRFSQAHEELSPAITLAQTFAQMVRERASGALEEWITQAPGLSCISLPRGLLATWLL